MAEPSRTGEFLRRAFTIVREDVPAAWTRMAERAPRAIHLQIDEDRFVLVRAADALELIEAPVDGLEPDVRIRATTDALFTVLDGRSTMLAALLDGTVFVAGEPAALAEAQSALMAFLQGCVRTRRSVALLEELRASRGEASRREPVGREAA
jgi:hypothetical protein